MRYWIARLFGRADGPAVVRCIACERWFPRQQSQIVAGATVCSDDCAESYARDAAW